MRVESIVPLSDAELKKVRDILRESKCPHESLSATFPGVYHHMTEDEIFFGSPPWDISQEI